MEERIWEAEGSASEIWDEMAKGVRMVVKKKLEGSRDFEPKGKGSQWWKTSM